MRRRIHSKIILFKGRNDDFALIGSPNFTYAGLKEVFTVGKSNFETALLVRGKKISKLISKLDFAKITKEEIKASRVLWSFETIKEYSHHIISAHYDSFEGLRVEFLCQQELPALYIKTQSSDKTVLDTYEVNINPGQTQILLHPRTRIAPGTTLWLCSEKGDQISNKVCVNVIISTRKFISMTKAEWIENMLVNLINLKTIGDLWRLLPLFLTSEDLESAAKTQQKRYSREYGYPSRIKTTMMSSTDIIEYLEDVFKSKRLREQEISRFDHPLPTISFQTKKTTKELIDRLVSKFAQYFEENRLQIDNSPDEYTLYVLFATKLCEVLCLTFQATELLESLLSDSISYFEEFLETHSISYGDCSRLLSLLIWAQSEFSCRVKDDTMERIAERSRVIPSELFDLDNAMSKACTCLLKNAKKLGLSIANETSFLMLAERVALSTLKHRTNLWKYFTPKQSNDSKFS